MHHWKNIACLSLFAALLPASQVAAAPVKLLGLNDMSCSAWKATGSDPEQRAPYVQWVRGFLSGHNYANQSKQVAEVSVGTVTVFIDRYCAERAAGTVADAAMRMSDQYSGRNSPITR
jgi:ABC-type tungstate transport system permease subunit